MGEDGFEALSRAYVDKHPSRFYSLRYFGQYLADFITSTPPYNGEGYLSELARFEWSFVNAFDSTDKEVVGESVAAEIEPQDWPVLTIGLHPSVKFVSIPLERDVSVEGNTG